MKSPDDFLFGWFSPLVFGAWAYALVYLLLSGTYTAFLRPEFAFLLWPAALISMGFMFFSVRTAPRKILGWPAVLRGAVLLLPLLFLLPLTNTNLGTTAFQNRFVASKPSPANRPPWGKPAQTTPPQSLPGMEHTKSPEGDTILDLYRTPKQYEGRRISVIGRFLRDERLKPSLGGRETLVYRFLVTCCAADAQPLAVALDSEAAMAFSNDQWVRVEGLYTEIPVEDGRIPRISHATLTPVNAPTSPYLY